MIDFNLIRSDPEKVRAGLKNRGGRSLPEFDELVKLDAEHRRALTEVEGLRAKRNSISSQIGKAKAAKDEALAESLKKQVSGLKPEMAGKEDALEPLSLKTRQAALGLPNLPHESVPLGGGPEDNPEVRSSGKPGTLPFKPLDHHALGEKLGILDFNAGVKLAGSRFTLLRGQGAKLLRSIITLQLDLHTKRGYTEIWPPYLVRPEILTGTGQLPKFEADLYRTRSGGGDADQDLFLIPTAEVPLTNLVREEILKDSSLPLRFVAYTPCFRQEAGSYGKDVRGLIRNHQFDKVELVWITKPEESLAALETLTQDAEEVLKILGIPYRVIELCTGDLGPAARKTYDLEIWMPGEDRYREISSCSDCGDYQARRMNARFKGPGKETAAYVHTLNGSGVAVGRLLAAVLENFQQADGSVKIPEALVPYFGAESLTGA